MCWVAFTVNKKNYGQTSKKLNFQSNSLKYPMVKAKTSLRSAITRAYWSRREEWTAQTTKGVRWNIIALLHGGFSVKKIADKLRVDRATVRFWRARWKTTGVKRRLPLLVVIFLTFRRSASRRRCGQQDSAHAQRRHPVSCQDIHCTIPEEGKVKQIGCQDDEPRAPYSPKDCSQEGIATSCANPHDSTLRSPKTAPPLFRTPSPQGQNQLEPRKLSLLSATSGGFNILFFLLVSVRGMVMVDGRRRLLLVCWCSQVLFSDETAVQLHAGGNQRVWSTGERRVRIVSSFAPKVLLWGALGAGGSSRLVRCGRVNAGSYSELLKKNLFPMTTRDPTLIFQQVSPNLPCCCQGV